MVGPKVCGDFVAGVEVDAGELAQCASGVCDVRRNETIAIGSGAAEACGTIGAEQGVLRAEHAIALQALSLFDGECEGCFESGFDLLTGGEHGLEVKAGLHARDAGGVGGIIRWRIIGAHGGGGVFDAAIEGVECVGAVDLEIHVPTPACDDPGAEFCGACCWGGGISGSGFGARGDEEQEGGSSEGKCGQGEQDAGLEGWEVHVSDYFGK